jgi:GNAT superfamily N-acetyltransferase
MPSLLAKSNKSPTNNQFYSDINYDEIYRCIRASSAYYPNFDEWFFDVVIDGYLRGERSIITEYSNGIIAGVAITKHTQFEKKLCNLTVTPEFANKGYGIKLFEKAFDILETNKPFLTVSEIKYQEFQKIFDYYGFEKTHEEYGLYQSNTTELFFNEKDIALLK